MRISGRYTPGLYAGVTGFLVLVGINAFTIPSSLRQADNKQAYQNLADLEKARLNAETDLEKEKARLQKRQSDAYSENQVLQVRKFAIWGYVDNEKKPPRIDFRAFPDPRQQVFIYDGSNKCIGYVAHKKFYWRHSQGNEDICNLGDDRDG
jgi:hypothetical protein